MAYAGQCRVSFPVRLGAHMVMRLLAACPQGPSACSVAPRGMIGGSGGLDLQGADEVFIRVM